MKNARFFPLSSLLIAWAGLTVGCRSSESDILPAPKRAVPFTLSATQRLSDDDPASRAVLEANSSRWQPDDAIALYVASYGSSGTAQETLRAETLSDDAKRAVFRGNIETPAPSDTYYAAYPADASVSAERIVFEIPAEQTPTAAPQLMMAAHSAGPVASDDVALAFEPVNAFLHVTLGAGVSGLTSVELEGCDGETIAGSYVYAFADGSSTLSGDGRRITVSAPTSDFYFTLPAVRLARGYRLTFRRGDETMIKCFGYDTGREFRAGGIYTVPTVESFVPMGVDMSGIRTSYDYYLAGDIARANAADGSTIELPAELVLRGISSKLVSSVTLTRNGEALPLTLTRADASGIHYALGVSSLAGLEWQDHEFALAVTHSGQTETFTRTVAVTGLPYRAVPPTNSGDHPWTGNKSSIEWSANQVKLVTSATPAPYITSPAFHIPAATNVALRTSAQVNGLKIFGWINTTFKVSIGSTTVISQGSEKQSGKTFDLTGNGTFTSADNSVKCLNDYKAAGPHTIVYSMDIRYR